MNNNTDQLKSFAKICGYLGVIGGIISLVLTIVILAGARISIYFGLLGYPVFLFRLAMLVLGIVGTVKFNADKRVPTAAHILLTAGLIAGLIFGPIGDICIIIAGAIYLSSLKKINDNNSNQLFQ
ncbi:hypothetical protein ACVR0S_03430 [Streptococcus dentapri]|uniref:Uncharacterized protein n=1 Tax=Streptococcus dentapri TaxID=573564 RepID=A0ABV8D2I0_9STRE